MNKEEVILIIFIISILAGVGVWTYFQWHECRDAGMSIFYCIKHVS